MYIRHSSILPFFHSSLQIEPLSFINAVGCLHLGIHFNKNSFKGKDDLEVVSYLILLGEEADDAG